MLPSLLQNPIIHCLASTSPQLIPTRSTAFKVRLSPQVRRDDYGHITDNGNNTFRGEMLQHTRALYVTKNMRDRATTWTQNGSTALRMRMFMLATASIAITDGIPALT